MGDLQNDTSKLLITHLYILEATGGSGKEFETEDGPENNTVPQPRPPKASVSESGNRIGMYR